MRPGPDYGLFGSALVDDAEDHAETDPDGEESNIVDDEGEPESTEEEVDPQPTRIGDLGLRPGNKLIYHFDFGANVFIPMKLLRIDAGATKGAKLPAITAKKGKPPQQYE